MAPKTGALAVLVTGCNETAWLHCGVNTNLVHAFSIIEWVCNNLKGFEYLSNCFSFSGPEYRRGKRDYNKYITYCILIPRKETFHSYKIKRQTWIDYCLLLVFRIFPTIPVSQVNQKKHYSHLVPQTSPYKIYTHYNFQKLIRIIRLTYFILEQLFHIDFFLKVWVLCIINLFVMYCSLRQNEPHVFLRR